MTFTDKIEPLDLAAMTVPALDHELALNNREADDLARTAADLLRARDIDEAIKAADMRMEYAMRAAAVVAELLRRDLAKK